MIDCLSVVMPKANFKKVGLSLSKVIYFIPGTMCNEKLWQPAWQLLQQQSVECNCDYQLIHLVIPSSGSMDEVVANLANKITHDNAILVGFSLGGYIASAIALKLGNKLRHLLIVSNFPQNLPAAEVKQRNRTVNWIKQRGYSGIPDKRIDDLLHPNIKAFSLSRYQDIKNIITVMDQELGGNVLLHQIEVSLLRPDLLPLLANLTLPITFLVGDKDNLVDLVALRAELTQAPITAENITIEDVANTGHMLPLESPEALAKVLANLIIN
ncbi:MAG: 2-succinyl-6-hydroxy-2,4-cyclohexadiene-1-carboxylate synthase [Colwellia sp.]|mgnify:FL=1